MNSAMASGGGIVEAGMRPMLAIADERHRAGGLARRALAQEDLAELSGAAGPRSEIEFALGGARSDYEIGPLPGLRQSGWDLGAAVKQGHQELADSINATIGALREEGVIAEIFARYHASYQAPARTGQLFEPDTAALAQKDESEYCKRRP